MGRSRSRSFFFRRSRKPSFTLLRATHLFHPSLRIFRICYTAPHLVTAQVPAKRSLGPGSAARPRAWAITHKSWRVPLPTFDVLSPSFPLSRDANLSADISHICIGARSARYAEMDTTNSSSSSLTIGSRHLPQLTLNPNVSGTTVQTDQSYGSSVSGKSSMHPQGKARRRKRRPPRKPCWKRCIKWIFTHEPSYERKVREYNQKLWKLDQEQIKLDCAVTDGEMTEDAYRKGSSQLTERKEKLTTKGTGCWGRLDGRYLPGAFCPRLSECF